MNEEQVPNQENYFAVVQCKEAISASIEEAWRRIGSFSDAGRFLKVSSALTSGNGGLGSIRLVNGLITEMMVGEGEYTYTYMQTVGPMASFGYHGCVALRSVGPRRCDLTYTILYNQTTMDNAQRLQHVESLRKRFGGAVLAMKAAAEVETGLAYCQPPPNDE